MHITQRPIPKYLVKAIRRADKKQYPSPCTVPRFYAYLTKYKNKLVKVTVAVKHYKGEWYCKQVAWHGIHEETCYLKDIEYKYMGGYRVGWYDEGIQKQKRWYERGICYAHNDYYDPWAPVVNLDYLEKFPEYKYSAWKYFNGSDILSYLRLYEQYPQLELLMKLGFQRIAQNKLILKRIGKDRKFCKWLLQNKTELQENFYYIDVILKAYQTGRLLKELQEVRAAVYALRSNPRYKDIGTYFRGNKQEQLIKYLNEQDVKFTSYADYFKACVHLGLDMTEAKNRFPHDFKRWHDIRIDQYATAVAEADRKAKQEQYNKFACVSQKYLPLEDETRSTFICLIARTPADLVREGEMLHHCVGKMNYDQRFIREESLIFFVRAREQPDIPYVTLEYSLKTHKVLQCYGEHDHRPNDDVLHYVNDVWLPYANKKLRKIKA